MHNLNLITGNIRQIQNEELSILYCPRLSGADAEMKNKAWSGDGPLWKESARLDWKPGGSCSPGPRSLDQPCGLLSGSLDATAQEGRDLGPSSLIWTASSSLHGELGERPCVCRPAGWYRLLVGPSVPPCAGHTPQRQWPELFGSTASMSPDTCHNST